MYAHEINAIYINLNALILASSKCIKFTVFFTVIYLLKIWLKSPFQQTLSWLYSRTDIIAQIKYKTLTVGSQIHTFHFNLRAKTGNKRALIGTKANGGGFQKQGGTALSHWTPCRNYIFEKSPATLRAACTRRVFSPHPRVQTLTHACVYIYTRECCVLDQPAGVVALKAALGLYFPLYMRALCVWPEHCKRENGPLSNWIIALAQPGWNIHEGERERLADGQSRHYWRIYVHTRVRH